MSSKTLDAEKPSAVRQSSTPDANGKSSEKRKRGRPRKIEEVVEPPKIVVTGATPEIVAKRQRRQEKETRKFKEMKEEMRTKIQERALDRVDLPPPATKKQTEVVDLEEHEEEEQDYNNGFRKSSLTDRLDRGLRSFLPKLPAPIPQNLVGPTKELIHGPVEDFLRWVHDSNLTSEELQRWIAATLFIVTGCLAAENPPFQCMLHRLVVLCYPESALGFIERCEAVMEAVMASSYKERYQIVPQMLNRLRLNFAMAATLKYCFAGLWRDLELSVGIVNKIDETRAACWMMWRLFWQTSLPPNIDPKIVVHSQLVILQWAFDIPLEEDDETQAESASSAAAGSGEASQPADDPDKIDKNEIKRLLELFQATVPERIQSLFPKGLVYMGSFRGAEAYHLLTPFYTDICLRGIAAFDDRFLQPFPFVGSKYVTPLLESKCVSWINIIIAKYTNRLFSNNSRKIMERVRPDLLSHIESLLARIVAGIAASTTAGVSDFGATMSLYCHFVDAVVESESTNKNLDMLLASEVFHRSLFAVAAQTVAHLAPIVKHPDVLNVCRVDALDFFKAGILVAEKLCPNLPEPFEDQLWVALKDVLLRSGWRETERIVSDSVEDVVLEQDDLFFRFAREQARRILLDVSSVSGMLSTNNGRAVTGKALDLLDYALRDENLTRQRNLYVITLCCLYASARCHRLSFISFEVLCRELLGSLTDASARAEAEKDLKEIKLDNPGIRGNVVEFYNEVFLLHGRNYIEATLFRESEDVVTLSCSSSSDAGINETKEAVAQVEPCLVDPAPNPKLPFVHIRTAWCKAVGLPFEPKKRKDCTIGAQITKLSS